MTFTRARLRLLPVVVATLLFLAGCVEPSVSTSTGQRTLGAAEATESNDPATGDTGQQQGGETDDIVEVETETPAEDAETPAEDAETPADPEEAPADSAEAPAPAGDDPPQADTAEPVPPEEPEPTAALAAVPADLCLESAGDAIADVIGWGDVGLGRAEPESVEYTDSAGDPARSFVSGTLGCTATFDDGSVLNLLGYTNYDINSYVGTRATGTAAFAVPVFTAAEPELVRVVIEYPWAGSPTGVAALEITFNDPSGIEATEIDAIEQLAATIVDEVAFDPPDTDGPTYPDWYECSLNRFGTTLGDTTELANALDQADVGLHANEAIDRAFGTASCSLAEGPGTVVTGGFAVGDVFVALAAYEAGRSTFNDTLSQVANSPGVEQGTLDIAGVSYRTFAAEGTLALVIETDGNGVMSIFDPAGTTPLDELEGIMRVLIAQLFATA